MMPEPYRLGWQQGLSVALTGGGFFAAGSVIADQLDGYTVGYDHGRKLFNKGFRNGPFTCRNMKMSIIYKGEKATIVETNGAKVRLSVNGSEPTDWLYCDDLDIDYIRDEESKDETSEDETEEAE